VYIYFRLLYKAIVTVTDGRQLHLGRKELVLIYLWSRILDLKYTPYTHGGWLLGRDGIWAT
jgi:hypothetical protein